MASMAGKRRHDEDEEQSALVSWARMQSRNTPELALLVAIPNGGYRRLLEAKRMKATGTSAGFLDLILPVARRGYHGLAIEMKRAGGKRHDISPDQYDWIGALWNQGWYATVAFGWDEARSAIEHYIGAGSP